MKKAEASKKLHPVPPFIEADLGEKMAAMSIPERLEFAEKLEAQAAQLRSFRPKPVEFVYDIRLRVRPEMKRALLKFAQCFGATECLDENTRLEAGALWFLETSLAMFREVVDKHRLGIAYQSAEDLEYTVYLERQISVELAEFEREQAEIQADSE